MKYGHFSHVVYARSVSLLSVGKHVVVYFHCFFVHFHDDRNLNGVVCECPCWQLLVQYWSVVPFCVIG